MSIFSDKPYGIHFLTKERTKYFYLIIGLWIWFLYTIFITIRFWQCAEFLRNIEIIY